MKKRRLRGQPPTEPEQRTAPPRPQRPATEQTPAAAEPPPARGFRAAFSDLLDRKRRELAGTLKWLRRSDAAKDDRTRDRVEAEIRAEAKLRAEREMARRIERQTGRKPALSTVRRNAAKDSSPRGVDQERLNRQAAVDRAGGIKEFAAQAKVSPAKARRWLTSGTVPVFAPSTVGAIVVNYHVVCDIHHYSHKRKTDTVEVGKVLKSRPGSATGPLVLTGEDAADFLRAHAADDAETLKVLLADQINMHELANWDGEVTRSCTITEIIDLEITE